MSTLPTAYEQDMQRRTELLLGTEALHRIRRARVIIFGVGGVGSWCAESLVRSGVRCLTLVDSDRVCVTNCNRQLMATHRTLGQPKVEALRDRLLDINPDAHITTLCCLYSADTADTFQLEEYDYIVDAIDSLRDKADLILRACALPRHITLVSSMGAALRTDPFRVRRSEFWSVRGDALARALRDKFKRAKTFPARKFQCVYSEEPARRNALSADALPADDAMRFTKVQTNGSLCHVTAVFGMSLAGMIINHIIES